MSNRPTRTLLAAGALLATLATMGCKPGPGTGHGNAIAWPGNCHGWVSHYRDGAGFHAKTDIPTWGGPGPAPHY